MKSDPTPTERELEILKVLWDRGEASVREVHQTLSQELPIVQNTVQAFLRVMEEKGLVTHRVEGRSFIYTPTVKRNQTNKRLVSSLLQRAFDGAVDQLVQSAFSLKQPSADEIARLEQLIAQMKQSPKNRREERS